MNETSATLPSTGRYMMPLLFAWVALSLANFSNPPCAACTLKFQDLFRSSLVRLGGNGPGEQADHCQNHGVCSYAW